MYRVLGGSANRAYLLGAETICAGLNKCWSDNFSSSRILNATIENKISTEMTVAQSVPERAAFKFNYGRKRMFKLESS